ncbi:hypothetical protein [Priestia sp. AB]|uniref:hypothetical protein n=1 Tax=Priestia sp. AB TaxID=3020890 RepID=UPI002330C2DC|nr:hypothetical protein [Priestia sp. AB]MDC0705967.1 hypothetical protein [Priestia sp. AB]
MDVKESEKTIRLKVMLEESLKPMTEKLEKLNEEVETIRKNQQNLQKMLEEIIIK